MLTDRSAAAPADTQTHAPDVDLTPHERRLELLELPARTGLVGASRASLAIKRLFDVVLAAVALVALAPVFVAVTAAIATTSGGPVFFVQPRVGRDGKTFRMLKFRTMEIDAHDRRSELAHLNVHAEGPIFKLRDDPRVTAVGRVLRRFSIDELPQFVNVLLGHMSIVGPRPPLPEEVAAYDVRERQRLLAKPGLTCLWQISGRSDVDFRSWVEMDLLYIRTWSLRLDARIVLGTPRAVLSRRGAY